LAQICTKSFVGWGFAQDPTGEAYSAPSDSLAVFRGPTSKGDGLGKGGKGTGRQGGEDREEMGGEGRRGEGRREFVLCPRKKKKSRRLWFPLHSKGLIAAC